MIRRVVAHERRPRPFEQPLWLVIPLGITLSVLAALIMLATPREHLLGAVLAYVNLLVIGAVAVHFVRQGSLPGLIPVLFLLWFAAGWPLPTIYFATMFPSEAYHPFGDERLILFNAARVQGIGLLFLSVYLATVSVLHGRYPAWTHATANPRAERRAGSVVLWIVIAAISVHAASQIVPLPTLLAYVANGSYNYLHGLMLMVGVLFLRVAPETRLRALLFLAVAGAFYLIGNARGLAVLPATLFAVGLVFVSDIPQRYKTWAVILVCAGLPLALVIGNTTRILLGSIGFHDMGTRLNALGEWQAVLSETPVLVATFHRLFFVGGHSIIAYTPEHFPYLPFSWSDYGWELTTRLLPGKLFYAPYYSDNERLQAYGFLITESTSFPLSLLGSLYMLGGAAPVALGAVAFGVFHALLGRLVGWAIRRDRHLGLFIFSMIASTLIWSQNVDLITNVRVIAWRVLSAFILYYAVLRPLIGTAAARRPRRPLPVWQPPSRGRAAGGIAGLPHPTAARAVGWGPR